MGRPLIRAMQRALERPVVICHSKKHTGTQIAEEAQRLRQLLDTIGKGNTFNNLNTRS